MSHQLLIDFFDQHALAYQLHVHEPVFTVEASQHLHVSIPGAHSKNLFLKDKKGSLFLVSVPDHKRVDLKALSKMIGQGNLSFASAELLMDTMKLIPGSVTPYGLLHDQAMRISFILDTDFLSSKSVNFHPLRNDMTLSTTPQMFLHVMDLLGHAPRLLEIPSLR